MIKVLFYDINKINDDNLKIAVIVSKYKNKWIFVQHKERKAWELPAGHREKNETIYQTAQRELWEEAGAKNFELEEICDYSVTSDHSISYGRLFYAKINGLEPLPNFEIKKINFFQTIPKNLTYPTIQKILFNKILSIS
jgi:8-oxo-dGTP diphosphatase